uniref:EF-hand domain-containing protein n=1 Tax=Chrysotila carterae TaxID=13221 RepID=A0A7S4C3M9_CHRCT
MRPLLHVENNWTETMTSWFGSFGYNFSSCERLHSVIRQSFAAWQQNSAAFRLREVTDECTTESLWKPVPEKDCIRSPYCLRLENGSDWTDGGTPLDTTSQCTFATCFECERADVIVGGYAQRNRDLGDHANARIAGRSFSEAKPLRSDGVPADGVLTVTPARPDGSVFLQFSVETQYSPTEGAALTANCWRLDADLCRYLSWLPQANTETLAVVAFALSFTCCACACFCGCILMLKLLANNLLAGWDTDGDGQVELQEMVYVLDEFCGDLCFECRCPSVHSKKMSPLSGMLGVLETTVQLNLKVALLFTAFLLAIPLVYFGMVEPCWTCQDLRASAAHEIGHLLSLGNPLDPEELMLSYNRTGAQNASELVGCMQYPVVDVNGSDLEFDALMKDSRTQTGADGALTPPMLCLEPDDLDGLHYVFPSCGEALPVAACPARTNGAASVIRLMQIWVLLIALVCLCLVAIKVLAFVILLVEDFVASRRLNHDAEKVVKEAKKPRRMSAVRRFTAGESKATRASQAAESPST